MELRAAIYNRHATRSFLSTPVSKRILEELFELARWAPSGGNLQPWQVFALTGKDLSDLRILVHQRWSEDKRETPSYRIYPEDLWEPYRTRRWEAGAQRYSALGLDRSDASRRTLEEMNLRFFDAPVGLFFFVDRRSTPLQWSDLGMFMQTLMLAAVEKGMASCPQAVWAQWPTTVAQFLGVSDNLMLFAGMSLGYSDRDAAINAGTTPRAGLDTFATLRGFPEPGD